MKFYKQWSPQERMASSYKTKLIMAKLGIPRRPPKCNRCGQTEGIIEWHNNDYSDPMKYLEPLCWRCHIAIHCEDRVPAAVEHYFKQIKCGFRFPPVYKKDFSILRRDHNF